MKMNRFKVLVLGMITLLAAGCKAPIADGEMKGILTVDKSAFGNAYLEFNDPVSKQTRFIHPGKKIITISKSIYKGTMDIALLDSRRVQLAMLQIPASKYEMKDQTFMVKAKDLNQNWDLKGKQTRVPLRTEIHPTRAATECQAYCNGVACKGWKGVIFRVSDYRFDYEIQFMPENTQLIWGKFLATGEFRTQVQTERVRDCQPSVTVHQAVKESF